MIPTLLLAVAIPATYWTHAELFDAEIHLLRAESVEAIIAAQFHAESTWRADASSPVGASGIAQLMPRTRDWIFPTWPDCADKPVDDVRCNMRAGIWLDLWNARRFRYMATHRERMAIALASYNAGAGWIRKERQKCTDDPNCRSELWFGNVENMCVRSPRSCAETRTYVRKIFNVILPAYKALQFGIQFPNGP